MIWILPRLQFNEAALKISVDEIPSSKQNVIYIVLLMHLYNH